MTSDYQSRVQRIRDYKYKIQTAEAKLKELNKGNLLGPDFFKTQNQINILENNIHQYRSIITNLKLNKPSHGTPLTYQKDITTNTIRK